MTLPAMSPPRKDPSPNQDINIFITKQYPILPPIKAKCPPGFKPLFIDAHDPNGAEYVPNYSTDNSSNEKEDSANKLKVTNN